MKTISRLTQMLAALLLALYLRNTDPRITEEHRHRHTHPQTTDLGSVETYGPRVETSGTKMFIFRSVAKHVPNGIWPIEVYVKIDQKLSNIPSLFPSIDGKACAPFWLNVLVRNICYCIKEIL